MKKVTNKVGYSMTFEELIIEAGKKSKIFRRDETRLQEMGIMPEVITSFEQMTEALIDLPADIEMEAKKMKAVSEKNQTALQIRTVLKKFVHAARVVYKTQSYNLYCYNLKIEALGDADLMKAAYTIARTTRENVGDFAAYNITAEDCDNLNVMQTTLRDQLYQIQMRIVERDAATENRWTKANEVYNLMMDICNTGKFIWKDESEAYYNDYIVYKNSGNSNTTDNSNNETENEESYDGVPEYDYGG